MQLEYTPRDPEGKIAALIGGFLGGLLIIFLISRALKKTPLFKNKEGFENRIFFPIALSWAIITIFASFNMGINKALLSYILPSIVLFIWDTVRDKKKGNVGRLPN